MGKKFYAVYHGMSGASVIQGVFSAVEFKKEWINVPGNLYKGFNSYPEAINWLTFIKEQKGDEPLQTDDFAPSLSSLPEPPLKNRRKTEEELCVIDRSTSPIVFPRTIRRNLILTKPDSPHNVDSHDTHKISISQ
ncbi:hypothetical protein RCL1_005224 [Eukaryota sp. TZLM3-RCL]